MAAWSPQHSPKTQGHNEFYEVLENFDVKIDFKVRKWEDKYTLGSLNKKNKLKENKSVFFRYKSGCPNSIYIE